MLNSSNKNFTLSLDLQQKLQDRKVFEEFKSKLPTVTCDTPKGHLVHENLVQQFASTFTDTFQDAKNLTRALSTGKANDHELGRMNDLGMKIGGGLIAAALMGSRQTTAKKLMEVFGFATFFSVMSLWPKVAFDLPTKLRFGFNPHQKYIDSQGRKKQFFLDNQYLPWDVWTKDDINKVADRMGVPKDMKDREAYTKEKMRTIALQDNTMWMLTAGFSTPLLTSLICNRIEAGIRTPVAHHNLKALAKNAANPDAAVKKVLDNQALYKNQDKAFEGLLSELRHGRMPEDFANRLASVIEPSNLAAGSSLAGNLQSSALVQSQDMIARLFPSQSDILTNGFIENLVKEDGDDAVQEAHELFSKAVENARTIKNKNIRTSVKDIEILEQAKNIVLSDEAYSSKPWAKKLMNGVEGLSEEMANKVRGNVAVKQFNFYNLAREIADGDNSAVGEIEELLRKGLNQAVDVKAKTTGVNVSLDEILEQVNSLIDADAEKYASRKWVEKIASGASSLPESVKPTGSYSKEVLEEGANTLENIYHSTIRPIQARYKVFSDQLSKLECVSGDKYNSVLDIFFKELKFTDKEVTAIEQSSESYADAIKDLFTKKFAAIASDENRYNKVVNRISKEYNSLNSVTNPDKTTSTIQGVFDNLMDGLNGARKEGAQKIAELGKGGDLNLVDYARGAAMDESSVAKTLSKNLSSEETALLRSNITSVDAMVARLLSALDLEKRILNGSLADDWAKYAKELGLSTDVSTLTEEEMTKLYNACRSVVWGSTYGDVTNKFQFDGNGEFYKHVLTTAFDTKSDNPLVQNWNEEAKKLAFGTDSITNPQLNIKTGSIFRSHNENFAAFGESTLDALKKKATHLYSDRKWLKIFGGATIALLAVTFISQLFFGKIKDEKLYKDSFEREKK